MIHKPSQLYPKPTKKHPQKQKQPLPPTPLLMIKACKKSIGLLHERNSQKQPLDLQSELECLRAAAQLNNHLSLLSLEFVSLLLGQQEIQMFSRMFSRIGANKQIWVCLFSKAVQAQVYEGIPIKVNKGQSMEKWNKFSDLIYKFVDVCQFWYQMNQNRQTVVYACLIEGLNKIRKWIAMVPSCSQIVLKIEKLMQQMVRVD